MRDNFPCDLDLLVGDGGQVDGRRGEGRDLALELRHPGQGEQAEAERQPAEVQVCTHHGPDVTLYLPFISPSCPFYLPFISPLSLKIKLDLCLM